MRVRIALVVAEWSDGSRVFMTDCDPSMPDGAVMQGAEGMLDNDLLVLHRCYVDADITIPPIPVVSGKVEGGTR